MKIAFTGAPDYMDRTVGYGEASYHIYKTFEKHGIECVLKNTNKYTGVSLDDLIELEPEYHKPNICLSFIFPPEYSFGPNQYKIGYTPWESTGVFPNWINPLQAIAKGIPTISTHAWASYAQYITLPVDGEWHSSPWPETHPGQMIRPNKQQLKEHMLSVYNNYKQYSAIAYRNSFLAHKNYNWDKVSKPAVQRLKEIQKSNF